MSTPQSSDCLRNLQKWILEHVASHLATSLGLIYFLPWSQGHQNLTGPSQNLLPMLMTCAVTWGPVPRMVL